MNDMLCKNIEGISCAITHCVEDDRWAEIECERINLSVCVCCVVVCPLYVHRHRHVYMLFATVHVCL